MLNPYKISIFARNNFTSESAGTIGAWVCDVRAPISLRLSLRHNDASVAEIVVAYDDPTVEFLVADGARAMIWKDGELLFTGVLNLVAGEGPTIDGRLTATFISDFNMLRQVVTFPYAGQSLPASGYEDPEKYWEMTGPAETVAKALLTQNLARHPVWASTFLDLRPTAGLGSSITVRTRYETLHEVLVDAVDKAGIGLSFTRRLSDGKIVVDAYAVTDFPHVLDESSGIVSNWSYSSAPPAATWFYSGATWQYSYDVTTAAPTAYDPDHTETKTIQEPRHLRASGSDPSYHEWGIREAYKAAQGGQDFDVKANVEQAIADEVAAQVADAGARSGLSITLSPNGQYQYGAASGLYVGMRVTLNIGGATRTDILRQVDMEFTHDNGDVVSPTVGDVQDDPDKNLLRFLATLRKNLHRLEGRI